MKRKAESPAGETVAKRTRRQAKLDTKCEDLEQRLVCADFYRQQNEDLQEQLERSAKHAHVRRERMQNIASILWLPRSLNELIAYYAY